MDRQVIFNTVSEHLTKQNQKALEIDQYSIRCLYKNKEGLRCAIGCLIPDDHMGLGYSGDVTKLQRFWPDIFGTVTEDDMKFLKNLQVIHDGFDVSEWKKMLRYHAGNWELELPDCLKDNNGTA